MVAIAKCGMPFIPASEGEHSPSGEASAAKLDRTRDPSFLQHAWAVFMGTGKCLGKDRPTSRGKKNLREKVARILATKRTKLPLPGIRVFAFRGIRHKYKPRGMKLDVIRTKRLARLFKLFHGKFDKKGGAKKR